MLKRKAGPDGEDFHDLPTKRSQPLTDTGNETASLLHLSNGNVNHTEQASQSNTEEQRKDGQNLEVPSALAQKSSATAEPGNSTDAQSPSAVAETGGDIGGDGSDVDGSCSTNPHANNETESHLDSDSSSSDDDAGENKWLPIAGPMSWVQRQMVENKDPRVILNELLPSGTAIPEGVHDVMLWKIIVSILSEPPKRKKLDTVNTMNDLIELIKKCSKIIVLTGAGVSVSCGIPDFRSRDGLYARLAVEYPDLPDPQAMFDINYFERNPYPFFKFAKEIYPGSFQPSPSHRFIKAIESKNKLLRNYTQNIDTLEQVADIQKVVQCHGSFANATCMKCKHKVTCADIKDEIFNQKIPQCKQCEPTEGQSDNIVKPDIVFFGESLPEEFHEQIAEDKTQCDLLIVIGSSLKVRPVSLIPDSLPPSIPQVLINREPLPHMTFDIELLGNCDVIVQELTRRLHWGTLTAGSIPHPLSQIGMEQLKPLTPKPSTMVKNKFQLRPPDVVGDSSLCLSDMETSQISSHNPDPMSVDGSPAVTRQDGNMAVSDTESTNNTAEHSFSGRLQEAISPSKPGTSSEKPSTSSEPLTPKLATESKSLSTRLPENTYLYLEPARYVFTGAEVTEEDGNSDSDPEEDDMLSSDLHSDIHSEPPYDPSHIVSDTDQHDSDNNECRSESSHPSTSKAGPSHHVPHQRPMVVHHDEDAFDAFPDTNSSSRNTLVGFDVDSPNEGSVPQPFQSSGHSLFRN